MWEKLMLVLIAAIAWSSSYNAREAHNHAHEIACHVGADDLCEYAD